MHLNIPPQWTSLGELGLLYARWNLLGVLGPELIVFVAWRQLNSARSLQKEAHRASDALMTAHVALKSRSEARSEQVLLGVERSWTIVHGFYAGMGGFVFDFEKHRPDEISSCFPPLQRLRVTARGVALLFKCELLPDISHNDIEDKSKSDHLAKTVICVQAAWFLIQVIGRRAEGLPVTLLDVNTLAHVICTFIL